MKSDLIPTGLRPPAQGCDLSRRNRMKAEERATLGQRPERLSTPKGVASTRILTQIQPHPNDKLPITNYQLQMPPGRNPFGVPRNPGLRAGIPLGFAADN